MFDCRRAHNRVEFPANTWRFDQRQERLFVDRADRVRGYVVDISEYKPVPKNGHEPIDTLTVCEFLLLDNESLGHHVLVEYP